MIKYELTIIINPTLKEEERKKLVDKMTDWVKAAKGKVEKIDDWGKKRLAYPIIKLTEGYYYLLFLELEEKDTNSIKKKLNLEETVIRFLLIRKEESDRKQGNAEDAENKRDTEC